MCIVSMVHQHGYDTAPWKQPDYDGVGIYDKDWIKRYMDAVKKAKELDNFTKQPDCEDSKKAEFMDEVLKRLDAIEKKLR